ncbi:hypothetical protein [Agrobacterium fabrum]|uniref:hypothetical protein n=1 Tax=Agrobacterium fabrum TaxID=1176649 RepID=UPI003B9E965F
MQRAMHAAARCLQTSDGNKKNIADYAIISKLLVQLLAAILCANIAPSDERSAAHIDGQIAGAFND